MSTVTDVSSLAPAVPPTLAVASRVSPSSSGHARPLVPLLAAAVILSQLADLATYRPEIELNPLIHPQTAVGLKVALVVLVLSTSYLVKSRLLLAAAVAAGLVGALSNVAAS